MAISFIGYHGAAASSVATTNAIGDLLLVCAYRSGTTTAATLNGNFTDLGTAVSSGGAGSTNVATRVGWRIATATNEGTGTWTNATAIACLVLRGTHATAPVVAQTTNAATAVQGYIRYAARTRSRTTNWFAAFGARLAAGANASVATAPNDGTTTITNRGSTPATPYLAGFANASSGDWAQTDVTIGGTTYKYASWVLDIQEPASVTPQSVGGTLRCTSAVTTQARRFQTLTGTLRGTGALGAVVKRTQGATGTLRATSALGRVVDTLVSVGGTLRFTGATTTGASAVPKAVSGTLQMTGGLGAALRSFRAVTGLLQATGAVTGQPKVGRALTGALRVTGDLATRLHTRVVVAGTLRLTAVLSGRSWASRAVVGTLRLVGTASGVPYVPPVDDGGLLTRMRRMQTD